MEDPVRSNVKPPTDQKDETAPELKSQGDTMVTGVPVVTLLKLPEVPFTVGLTQKSTREAVAAEAVFSVTRPVKPMLPTIEGNAIGMACAACDNAKVTTATLANLKNVFFILYFI